mgnify:CR=1 FL=1
MKRINTKTHVRRTKESRNFKKRLVSANDEKNKRKKINDKKHMIKIFSMKKIVVILSNIVSKK